MLLASQVASSSSLALTSAMPSELPTLPRPSCPTATSSLSLQRSMPSKLAETQISSVTTKDNASSAFTTTQMPLLRQLRLLQSSLRSSVFLVNVVMSRLSTPVLLFRLTFETSVSSSSTPTLLIAPEMSSVVLSFRYVATFLQLRTY